MAKDAIHEEIEKTMQNLEDQLKEQGFKDSDIEELKTDLEVEIKKHSSLTEIIGVIKKTQERVQKSKGKEFTKSENSIFDDLISDFKDYKADNLEGQVSIEELEDMEHHNDNPVLEETISTKNKYFSKGISGESLNIEYMGKELDHVYDHGSHGELDVSDAVEQAQEKQREMMEHGAYGKVKKRDDFLESTDHSSLYR